MQIVAFIGKLLGYRLKPPLSFRLGPLVLFNKRPSTCP